MKNKYDEPFKTIKLNNNKNPRLIVMNSDNT